MARGRTTEGRVIAEGRPAGISLATLAMAALLVAVVLERPAEAASPRAVLTLRDALRAMPSPLTRAARDLVGAPRHEALREYRLRVTWAPVPGAVLESPGVAPGAWVRPRESLLDLPPPFRVM